MADKKVFCLMGPTASGKTDLAIQLLDHFPFEIISVDSAMIYREMNIGTAKPSADVLRLAPHHLIDIRDPIETYSAAQFCADATCEIKKIFDKRKIPLLVGGTMMYFKALQQGLALLPSADKNIRDQILLSAEKLGWPALHQQLQKIDPDIAKKIHPNDSQRIQRALEVFEISGMNVTDWQRSAPTIQPFKFLNICIAPSDRKILHQKIEQRFKTMLELGFVEEVEKLFARGDLSLDLSSIRSVGYRQVWEYLLGNYSYEEMVLKGIAATRQFAKRQMTWLNHWVGLSWFNSEENHILQKVMALISITYSN